LHHQYLTCVTGLVNVNGNSVSKIQPDFNALSKEIRKVTPTGTQMAAYTPTATARACPPLGRAWNAKASPLPPPPNPQLCKCMSDSLSCAVKSSTPETSYGNMFDYVCSENDDICLGILADAETGNYGAYSMCNPKEQLSFVLSQYVESNSDASCAFNGKAEEKQAATLTGQCKSLVSEAGKDGSGHVTTSPTAAGTSGGDSGSDDNSNAGFALNAPILDMGLLKVGMYMLGAFMTGAGLLLL
jgi:1,3-beta-glucanosyltransferase GAS1